MRKSKAAVFHSRDNTAQRPIDFEIQNMEIPAAESSQLVVRVIGCTLCRSDLHTIEGRRSSPMPTILGHEIVGEIEAIGPNHSGKDFSGAPLSIGDRVSWAIVASCGQCELCKKGVPQKCTSGKKYGHRKLESVRDRCGGLTEHCLLFDNSSVFRLPNQLPLEVACPANCATATVAATLRQADPVAGETFAVFGVGMLGLTACAMLRSRGIENVVAIDIDQHRLDTAMRFGATQTMHVDSLNADSEVASIDGALEYSGNWQAVHSAFDIVRNGGRVVLAGSVFPSESLKLTPEDIVRKNLTIVGAHNYQPDDLKTAIDFLEVHHLDFPFVDLVAKWYRLDQLGQAIEAAKSSAHFRVGIQFSGESFA